MNLIKQIVEEKIKFFNYERDNGNLDIWSFYQVYSLVSIIMLKEFNYEINKKRIKMINYLWRNFNISVLNNSYKKNTNLKKIHNFEIMINKDMELINQFLNKINLDDSESIKKIVIHSKGVVGEVVDLNFIKNGI